MRFSLPLSTRICWVDKPTPRIRSGIAPASLRKVEGFEVLTRKQAPGREDITARVAAGASVSCLCAQSCRVDVEGVGAVDATDGDVVVLTGSRIERVPKK